MSLESKHFVASPTDVEAITKAVLDAQSTGSSGRASYLKALIATTQQSSGKTPRRRVTSDERREQQLAAFETTHEWFSKHVEKAAREHLPAGYTPIQLNRATNFARSAASTLRAWLRAGNDIAGLDPEKVTKKALAVEARRKKKTSPVVLTNRANRWSDKLMKTAVALAGADEQVARDALESVVEKLKEILSRLPKRRMRLVA